MHGVDEKSFSDTKKRGTRHGRHTRAAGISGGAFPLQNSEINRLWGLNLEPVNRPDSLLYIRGLPLCSLSQPVRVCEYTHTTRMYFRVHDDKTRTLDISIRQLRDRYDPPGHGFILRSSHDTLVHTKTYFEVHTPTPLTSSSNTICAYHLLFDSRIVKKYASHDCFSFCVARSDPALHCVPPSLPSSPSDTAEIYTTLG